MKKIFVLFLAVLMAFTLIACSENKSIGIIGGADGPTAIFVSTGTNEADVMVSAAILAYNSGHYYEGECVAEGHLILTDKTENGKRVVSLFASYGEYGFENGNFVKVSGSGAIPCRITFDEDGNVLEYKEPIDGEGYDKSIREMYDDETYAIYEGRSKSGDAYTLCSEGERLYARRYLEGIGREAEIGEYGDFSHELLTDLGVSVEVSNAMISRKDEFSGYFPYFIGTAEHIIDGVRYVFETGYDEEKAEISYIQYEYGKSAPVRGMIYDSVTGELKEEF
ncbi:MAG: sodium ion-translocating decarboxylase subunit beta [Clostridia bacterium]|nr:sodium ion-translocating decarboxylase subunit beta [Clostridia bacterium]